MSEPPVPAEASARGWPHFEQTTLGRGDCKEYELSRHNGQFGNAWSGSLLESGTFVAVLLNPGMQCELVNLRY